MVRLFVGWVAARFDIADELVNGVADQRCGVAIAAHELGCRRKGQIYDVMKHQHLSVTLRSSANANGGGGDFMSDHGCYLAWQSFQHQGKYSGAVQRNGVFYQPFNASQVFD